MIDILDRTHVPDMEELSAYIGSPLFDELCAHLRSKYGAAHEMAFSREDFLPGWNIRFYKSGKTLCRAYPKKGSFVILVVVGRKEKPLVELLLEQMSPDMRELYERTREGMGQRWLMPELKSHDALYEDILTVIDIRRNSK